MPFPAVVRRLRLSLPESISQTEECYDLMRHAAVSAGLLLAWVLWSQNLSSRPDQWSVIDASETEAGCRRMLQERLSSDKAMFSEPGVTFRSSESGYVAFIKDEKGNSVMVWIHLYCLPESVDPRPK